MSVEYRDAINTEAGVISGELQSALGNQGNSADETQRIVLGLAYWFFHTLDTENPFMVRVHKGTTARVVSRGDIQDADAVKIEALKPILADPTVMVGQATLERFIPQVLSTALGNKVTVDYHYDGTAPMHHRYFEVNIG